jgi:hypothetical protein
MPAISLSLGKPRGSKKVIRGIPSPWIMPYSIMSLFGFSHSFRRSGTGTPDIQKKKAEVPAKAELQSYSRFLAFCFLDECL